MNSCIKYVAISLLVASCGTVRRSAAQTSFANEPHRPQIHFTPKEKWMNDPNGMVFFNNQYHLFYQYYPDSTVWGPMHWGHATSKDLVHWQHQPIALFPDSLGYIFSGSAVVDVNNTSGFGKDGKVPLVAIFTHHDAKGAKEGRNDFQNESIAYSLDEGTTWTKYARNPVVKNPGIKDFRDPKVSWNEETKRWIMTLATKDRVTFFSSPNLKEWTKESEFGTTVGAHGGVWECPDLFPLEYKGEKIWVLLVSINPGGPNGGSATQYFTGRFDGHTFIPFATDTRWVDYGPDNYAGVTWSNTGKRKIFLGWMSNWEYAQVVPTTKWRSAMTVPRELGLEKIGDKYLLLSIPVKELDALNERPTTLEMIDATAYDLTKKTGRLSGPVKLKLSGDALQSFSITFSNAGGEKLVVGYDKAANNYFIDRSQSGKIDFEKGFGKKHTAPRLLNKQNLDMTLVIDAASVELFADGGSSAMTNIFFPDQPYTNMQLQSSEHLVIKSLQYTKLNSIWR
jgi:fructan beta-fructosidase